MEPKHRILLIDDEIETLQAVGAILETSGYYVVGVATGREAIEKIKAEDFDLAIIDYVLPDIDGLQVAEELKKLKPSMSMVILTGKPSVDVAVKAMKSGIGDYVTKPINRDSFLAIISKNIKTQKGLEPEGERTGLGARLLLVDDEPEILKTLSEILKSEGFRISTADKGAEAVARLREEDIDLVILDYKMPDMNGLEVAAKIKEMKSGLPIVMLTGAPSVELAVQAMKGGINDFLTKPVDVPNLLKILQKNIKRKEESGMKELGKQGYDIIKEVGRGGFATVYKAWDRSLEKFVAVKKIYENYAQDAKFLDMFRQEARLTAKLDHENIVRVINFFKDPAGNYYMVMEFVEGVSLTKLLNEVISKRVKLPLDVSIFVMTEVLKALGYAHNFKDIYKGEELKLVHRDISPANVMVYFDGRVKLTDFGIADAASKSQTKSRNRTLSGKISYMSPEQALGMENVDQQSDLFSCGIVLWELVTGENLYAGTLEDILPVVQNAKINFTRLEQFNVPDKLQEIISKALQRDKTKRYVQAGEFLQDLENFSKSYFIVPKKEKFEKFIAEVLRPELDEFKKEISLQHEAHTSAPSQEVPEVRESVVSFQSPP
ncbi:MAG TPA: response regulator, partial [bacterium]|nr:response regulator [bacterium]